MENKLKNISGALLFVILIASCDTYQIFYSETLTTSNVLDVSDKSKILRLDLKDGKIDDAFLKWETLTELRMLNLSGNKGIELSAILGKIPNPEKLQVLILDDLNLKILPENIIRFKELNHLSLNKNPKLDWNESFQLMSVLPIQFLNLQYNNLNVLDVSISEIKSIKDLNLNHNNLIRDNLYTTLSSLPNLYSLWLGYNNIESLPTEIGQLKQLRNFYIPHNNLSKLPEEMATMKKVWVLHAEYNEFEELPSVLTKMPSLFSTHIGNCNIQIIPSIFATSKYSMKGLVMDNNQLSESDKIKWRKEFDNFFLLSIE